MFAFLIWHLNYLTSLAILIDFGSTLRKSTAVDLDKARCLAGAKRRRRYLPTCAKVITAALGRLHERLPFSIARPKIFGLEGNWSWRSSSAAGGLRIAVVGNVPGLTVQAANQAALGAGAKIVGSTAFKLAAERIQEIERLRPDMILLTGGVDGGDAETISAQCGMLASAELSMPIVVAGNQAVAKKSHKCCDSEAKRLGSSTM